MRNPDFTGSPPACRLIRLSSVTVSRCLRSSALRASESFVHTEWSNLAHALDCRGVSRVRTNFLHKPKDQISLLLKIAFLPSDSSRSEFPFSNFQFLFFLYG